MAANSRGVDKVWQGLFGSRNGGAKIPVKSVRTRSGDDGYDRSGSSAVFSFKTSGFDLHFSDKLGRNVVYAIENSGSKILDR